jgi:hypothetical protein
LLGAFHLQTSIRVVSMKGFVAIRAGVGALGDTTKAIEIELSLKGRQFGVAEISRQNINDKSVGISDHEGISLGKPTHDVGIFLS